MKINWNKKYTSISFYVILIALFIFTIITLYINGAISNLFKSILQAFQSVAAGLVIFYLVKPFFLLIDGKVFGFLGKKKKFLLQRLFSSIVVILILIAFLLLNVIFTLPNVFQNFSELNNNLQDYVINFDKMLESHESQYFPTLFPQIAKVVIDFTQNFLKILEDFLPRIEDLFNMFINIISIFVFGLIFASIYLYRYEDREAEIRYISHVILKEKRYNRLSELTQKAKETCIPFYRKSFLNSLGLGILTYLFLLIFGIEYAPILGVATFVFTFIPLFGHIIAFIFNSFIVFVLDWRIGIGFSVFLIAIFVVDYIFLYKKIIGKLGLTSVWILISLLLLLGFTGFLGILIGVPIVSIVYTLIREKVDKKLEKNKKNSKNEVNEDESSTKDSTENETPKENLETNINNTEV